jgi:glycosyltransferase involved in cell wall biosynthesis
LGSSSQQGILGAVPLFSVLIPVHNDPGHYPEAIESVLAQTFTDFELLVIDDGSDDPVVVPGDERITLLRNSAPAGWAAARNRALDVATGEHIVFLDSDDLFLPHRLEHIVTTVDQADLVVIGESRSGKPQLLDLDRVLRRTTPQIGTMCIGKSCLEQIGAFNADYLACADVELWVRLAERRVRTLLVPSDQFVFRRDDRPRLLNGTPARLVFNQRLLEDHRRYFAGNRRARAFRQRRVHAYALAQGLNRTAAEALWRSLVAWPSPRVGLDAVRMMRKVLRRQHVTT